jgi:5'-methylthioadenosine nucleosidase
MSELTESTVINHILVIIAMEAEAKPFLQALNLEKISLKTANVPSVAYQGVYNNCKVTVVTNGVCREHKVDNVGTTPGNIVSFAVLINLSDKSIFSRYLHVCGHQRVLSRPCY